MMRMPRRIRCQSDKLNGKDENGKPTYISLSQAKQILYLHESTIRHHIIRRRIRAFKSGGKWYVNVSDVRALRQMQSR
ncbi:MAG: helix-turn-helix domain-containing protein [Nostoc sp. TH1S01]|nr:helix-turn-helix domain-containing protein [Nostoc sp. TH1S01]